MFSTFTNKKFISMEFFLLGDHKYLLLYVICNLKILVFGRIYLTTYKPHYSQLACIIYEKLLIIYLSGSFSWVFLQRFA